MLFVLLLLVRVLARLLVLQGTDGGTKDLEILVLRHQLRVLRRKTGRPRFTTLDRIVLAAASRVLPPDRWASFLVTPQTLLRWHRMLVRSKWTSPRGRRPGRPAIDPEVAASSCGWQGRTPDGAASESPGRSASWASGLVPRRSGRCCDATAWVRRQGARGPLGRSSSKRRPRGSWRATCFTVETIRRKTLEVLFFIHLSSRRVVLAGITANPDAAWVTQQGRNVARQNRKSTVSGQASASDPPRFSRLQGVTAGTPTTLLHLARG